jgi:crotonobetainyl-CoA:carnitine CoA-transferase CaiB-like acyl-CoA transferase
MGLPGQKGALEGLRVLELGGEIAAPYATKLLAELGADVCKVEPPDGDPLRAWGPFRRGAERDLDEGGGLFRFLNGGKRSALADLEEPEGPAWLLEAAAGAELLVESMGPGELERLGVGPTELHRANPNLAIVRISDFGQRGPYVGIPTSGLTVQALGAWVSSHGIPDQPPVQVGARIHEYTAGAFAAAAALTACEAVRNGTPNVIVDLSTIECLVGTLPYPNLVLEDTMGAGLPPPQARWFPLPGIRKCKDGWVGINALTAQHFQDACAFLGVEEFAERQQELSDGGPLLEEFFGRIQPWLDSQPAQDVVELSQAFRVPAAPVGDGSMMLDYEQFRARPFFVEEDGVTMPGPPFRLSKTPSERAGRAPRRGEWGRPVTITDPAPDPDPLAQPPLPFSGLRVVDLGTFWAGPFCTMYLSALGAEVVKIESRRRPDGFRFSGAFPQMGDDWYDRGGVFAGTNLGKRDLTLELSTAEGRDVLVRLVEGADVVLENFSARVIEQFDLDYEQLRQVRPDLIMVRMPGFGLEGPWRDYVGWAMVIEQATGMASVTGPRDLPMHPGGLADPVIGMHAAVAVQAAIEHRARTGEGQLIEVAQLETGANLTAELAIEWSMRHTARQRDGNRDRRFAPQGVYQCKDDGPMKDWVALTIVDEQQWRALVVEVGKAEWFGDEWFSTLERRRARHDEIDAGITEWTRTLSADEVVRRLRPFGIPVARVLQVPNIPRDPQLVARGYFQTLEHRKTGMRSYPGWPMQFSFKPTHHRFGPPTLGQHNREILKELRMSSAAIDKLEADGIIGEGMAT